MGAFHAYDIRGIYNKDWDRTTAYKVGYFIPGLLGTKEVLVGRDCRVSSDEIHDALIQGINDAGADVYDIGLSSTPLVYFSTANYGFKASVQITASHNGPEYNGLKVSREFALPVGKANGLGQIEQWILEGRETPVAEKRGQVFTKDVKEDYLKFLRGYQSDISNLNIAMDLSNGMANLFARDIFGSQPSYILEGLDGRFPTHEPNPLVPKNIEMLQQLVRDTKADIGVIYDGDADRVMFVDENAEFISPDLIIAVLGHYFLEERGEKGLVIQDIRSSKAVGEYLARFGSKMYTWKVGRAFAAHKLREIDGIYGGELAGHYYFKDFFYSDSAMLASILALKIFSKFKAEGVSVSELISRIATYHSSGEINFRIEDKQGAMDALKEHFTMKEQATAIMDFDGYRVEFPQWWFNVRPSNTEPYLRFICEATSQELLDSKVAEAKKILQEKFDAQ